MKENDGVLDPNPVMAVGNIETWLQALVEGMQESIRSIIKMANEAVFEKELEEFIFGFPAQIALLGIQFLWTNDMQTALTGAKKDKTMMLKAFKKQETLLKEMIVITTRPDLDKSDRKNLETVITVHVHRDTPPRSSSSDEGSRGFEWMKQCRFYWRNETQHGDHLHLRCGLQYSCEYLGVKERLDHAPDGHLLRDSVSGARHVPRRRARGTRGYGQDGATKDLGNTLGKFVVVFNCSDQMDYKGMGKIYRGLARSGLWGCDEFNANLDVLSVCAQQVYSSFRLSASAEEFVFTDGAVVSLDPRVGFFITMNPGYAGRQGCRRT